MMIRWFISCLSSSSVFFFSISGIAASLAEPSTSFIATDTITIVAPSGNAVNPSPELIFSVTKDKISASQSITIRNDQASSITVTEFALSGANANAFKVTDSPNLPLTLAPDDTATINLVFSPEGTVGALSAELVISTSEDEEASVMLYGLSTQGLEGSNEPSLSTIVQTLGYSIDVGGTQLILDKGTHPIGDEVLLPLFQKADTGLVTLTPVARYSPDGPLAYGYYLPNGENVAIKEVATVAGDQYQVLYPALAKGGLTFDPGTAAFGLYADVTSYANQKTFTEDTRNTGPLSHAVRTYPIKNRSGALLDNMYLVCMEPARNGDYQDYVFLITNVKLSSDQ